MNNYNYLNYDWHNKGMRNETIFPKMNNNQKLYSPKEGFEKGNLFPNLYSEYNGYRPQNLNPASEQEEMLLNIQAICFASHELNLYLDMHPEDQSMLMLFNDYRRKKEDLIREYEKKYGPITLESNDMEKGKFSWVNSPWPWEVKNV